jgi:hypothetical protein
MGVFKEHACAFEAVAKKQSLIYNDACDHGYAYDKNAPPKEIEELIHYVKDLQGTSLCRRRTVWKTGVSVVIRIGWEIDGCMIRGTQYIINFNQLFNQEHNPNFLHKGCNAFISVYVTPYLEAQEEQINLYSLTKN